jgi:hypothetical protein
VCAFEPLTRDSLSSGCHLEKDVVLFAQSIAVGELDYKGLRRGRNSTWEQEE